MRIEHNKFAINWNFSSLNFLPASQLDGTALRHDDIRRGVLGNKVGRNYHVQIAHLWTKRHACE